MMYFSRFRNLIHGDIYALLLKSLYYIAIYCIYVSYTFDLGDIYFQKFLNQENISNLMNGTYADTMEGIIPNVTVEVKIPVPTL